MIYPAGIYPAMQQQAIAPDRLSWMGMELATSNPWVLSAALVLATALAGLIVWLRYKSKVK